MPLMDVDASTYGVCFQDDRFVLWAGYILIANQVTSTMSVAFWIPLVAPVTHVALPVRFLSEALGWGPRGPIITGLRVRRICMPKTTEVGVP